MGLEEEHVLFRVQATGDVLGQLVDGAFPQFSRVLADGDGMQVGHEIITLIVIDAVRPVFDSAEVIAQVKVSAGLDAGKHSFFLSFFHDGFI